MIVCTQLITDEDAGITLLDTLERLERDQGATIRSTDTGAPLGREVAERAAGYTNKMVAA